ncbi:hypothetical protein CDL12_27897 [Handroanthus impetiginosus]|uniref:Uncharacterized protein n=1 Tax=Handroanthus impetiginosus TaxID=429701 RepID=A0A2G9G2T6_9LAMI|nr:hypothetical protein CDL12_27897 [Handroanthus impetiginosus]
MGSFSSLGIGLSFLFGFILMGLVAELYYLLWWKKRISKTEIKPSFIQNQELTNSVRKSQEQQDLEMGSNKDLGFKGYGEEGVETELMRIHNLCGPPRFLFTIKEESKEDLESSPTFKTPHSLDSYSNHGFNPLFESLSESEINRLRSSPPPKFKFLKDAEDKLLRRLLVEEAERKKCILKNEGLVEEEGKSAYLVSFVDNSLLRDQIHNQASRVLPLASSPTFQPNES